MLTEGESGLDFTLTSQTCAVRLCLFGVTFKPLHPGFRRGAVEFIDPNGTVLSTTMIYGVGYGAQLGFGFNNQISASFARNPNAIALDGKGVLYFSDLSQQAVFKATSRTSSQPVVSGFAASALVFDGAGNLFIGDSTNQRVLKLTPSGQQSVVISNVLPTGLAVGGNGVLNIADQLGEQILQVSPNGKTTQAATGECSGLAFDGHGNLYAQCAPNDLLEISPNSTQSILATNVDSTNASLALDAAGSAYVSNTNSLFQLTPGGEQTTASGGYPTAVALDSSADVYYADPYQEFIFKVNRTTPNRLMLLYSGVTRTQTIENTGNAPMDNLVISTTGAIVSTSHCPQSLSPGQSCTFALNATDDNQQATSVAISYSSNGQTAQTSAPVTVFKNPFFGVPTTIQTNPRRQDSPDWVTLGGAVYPAADGITGTMTYRVDGTTVCVLPLAGDETSCRVPASLANKVSSYQILYTGDGFFRDSQATAN